MRGMGWKLRSVNLGVDTGGRELENMPFLAEPARDPFPSPGRAWYGTLLAQISHRQHGRVSREVPARACTGRKYWTALHRPRCSPLITTSATVSTG